MNMKEATANIKYLRYSPKKMKILARVFKGKNVHIALMQMESSSGKGYSLLKEAVKSAAANAVNNFKLDYSTLKIKNILSNEGPRLKRLNMRAQGRADRMVRPMMHIVVKVEGQETKEDIRVKKKTSTESQSPSLNDGNPSIKTGDVKRESGQEDASVADSKDKEEKSTKEAGEKKETKTGKSQKESRVKKETKKKEK